MKKLISIFILLLFAGVVSVSAQCCDKSAVEKPTDDEAICAGNQETTQVKVYYFHATRRCATCQAVEAVSKEAITEYYGDKVTFESINNEEEKDNPLIKKYKISGQTLLIIKGEFFEMA